MKAAVRDAADAEWRDTVAKRNQRRVWLALAASIGVAAVVLWVTRPFFSSTGEVVASVTRAIGSVQASDGAWGRWSRLTKSTAIHTGENLATGPRSRVALQLANGVSLRLDQDTRITFTNAGHVRLRAGAVYVDAGMFPGASRPLRVSTPAGVVWHVGTQYEARIVPRATRIRVREGRVDLIPTQGIPQSAHVGEELLVSTAGNVARSPFSPSDREWQWAANAAPSFDIDGRPVHEFLRWVGREVGREIVFATPESEAEAERVVLSGSVEGLGPAEALAAVLPTTRLRSVERGDGAIEISLQQE